MAIIKLNAENLLCPMPVIRTQDQAKKLNTGDQLMISCTDPGAKTDISAWCRISGHEVIEVKEQKDRILITILIGQKK